MKQNYLIIAILALVVGTGAFFAGAKYQQSKAPANGFAGATGGARTARNGQPGQGQAPGMMNRFGGQGIRPVNGEIISSDDKSVTVKMIDGSSKIVMLSTTATISKSEAGSKTDLKTGEKVMVFGTENTDGSITAQSIQLNPPQRGTTSAQPQGMMQTKGSPAPKK